MPTATPPPSPTTASTGGSRRPIQAAARRRRPTTPAATYSYDLAGRLTGVCDNSAAIATIAPTSTVYRTAYSYDALDQPDGVSFDPVPAPTLPATGSSATFGFTYNPANQRTAFASTDNAWIDYATGPPSTTAYAANSLNQYTAVGGVTPTYDGNGNLTSDGTFTFGYDAENRLTSASKPGMSATYAFDAQGRRKRKSVTTGSTAATVFVTDADNREVLEYDGSTGAIQRWYAYGLGPNDVVSQANVGAGTRVTPLPDLLGSIIATMDASNGVLTRYGYKPYGSSSSTPSQFGYTGQRVDGELNGYYYYRARHYSPSLGRFLQPDSAGYASGPNLYAYVGNDPLNATDPSSNWMETGWDLFNIALDTASLVSNIRSGSWGWATLDAIGLSYDVVATAVPFLPAGASAGFKSLRAGNSIETSFTIGADTIATANVANRVTSSAPTFANAGVQGTRYHNEVGAALDASKSLSEGARNAFGGRNRALGGPDVSWPGTNVWLDLTTAGQWARHETRYDKAYGRGVSLLYTAGKGLSGGLKAGGGMTLWGAQIGFGVGEAHGSGVSQGK